MGAYIHRATSARTQSQGSNTHQAPMPVHDTGDLLIWTPGANSTSTETITGVTGGWVGPVGTRGNHHSIYLRIAESAAVTGPTATYSGTGIHSGAVSAFGGDVYTDLNTILVATNNRFQSQTSLAAAALSNATHGFDEAGCLVFQYLARSKTATGNGSTYAAPTGFTVVDAAIPAGTADAGQVSYQQQTLQVDIAQENVVITGTAETVGNTGVIIALRSAATGTTGIVVKRRRKA